MKKYLFEASRRQWEKPTEPKAVFCPPVWISVLADSEEEALEKADRELTKEYFGTGVILHSLKLTGAYDLPVDWNYGYGDERLSGTAEEKAALWQACTK